MIKTLRFDAHDAQFKEALTAEFRERATVAEEREALVRSELLSRLELADDQIERLRLQAMASQADRYVLAIWTFAMGAGLAGLAIRLLG